MEFGCSKMGLSFSAVKVNTFFKDDESRGSAGSPQHTAPVRPLVAGSSGTRGEGKDEEEAVSTTRRSPDWQRWQTKYLRVVPPTTLKDLAFLFVFLQSPGGLQFLLLQPLLSLPVGSLILKDAPLLL